MLLGPRHGTGRDPGGAPCASINSNPGCRAYICDRKADCRCNVCAARRRFESPCFIRPARLGFSLLFSLLSSLFGLFVPPRSFLLPSLVSLSLSCSGEATLNVFHRNASTCWCSHEDASSIILSVLDAFSVPSPLSLPLRVTSWSWQGQYGILCFLYSLLLSRGLEMVEKDQGFENEPLIALPFGHAKYDCLSYSHVWVTCPLFSQALLNLVLCGLAVPNPWDGKKDMDGIGELHACMHCKLTHALTHVLALSVLNGIPKRNAIGYLTLLESLRYTACGSYYKTPAYVSNTMLHVPAIWVTCAHVLCRWPIWVLASETHFSVLFRYMLCLLLLLSHVLFMLASFLCLCDMVCCSLDKRLIELDSPRLHARAAFEKVAETGSGMLPVSFAACMHACTAFCCACT